MGDSEVAYPIRPLAEIWAEFSKWGVKVYRGDKYRRPARQAHAGRWVVYQDHVRMGRLLDGEDGVIVSYKTEDEALARCFALNLEERRIAPHRFEPKELTGRNRVPRCIHCGLLLRHARAHPRM